MFRVSRSRTFIKNMSLMEAATLVKELEAELGVSAAAPMMAAMPGAERPRRAAPVEEKDEFTVVLKSAGDKKIQVIKVVRELTGLGLKEAKDLVDGAPRTSRRASTRPRPRALQKKLEEAGGQVEVK